MFNKKVKKKSAEVAEKTKMKAEKIKKNNKEKSKKKGTLKKKIIENFKKNKKYYTRSIIALGIIIVIILIIYFLNIYFINKKYSKFEAKMDTYGFSLLYNNETSESTEKVTNLEGVKIVIGTIYNTYDASSIGYQPEGTYDGDEWVKTAEAFGILESGKINKNNINENMSYWDFIKLYLNARNKKLEMEVSYTNESKFKNLNSLTQEQKQYINDLVENGLIKNEEKKISLDKDIIKGQVNEIVINYVNKYNSIVEDDETIVTKEESMPTNSKYYPYIVYSIPNEIYEINHISQDMPGYISPKDLYKDRKEYYAQMEYRLTEYYNKILNINYKNIDKESFRTSIDDYLLYNYEDEIFDEYIKYVKENEIILEGKAQALLPIVYYDGIDFRVRMKLEFKIVNSKTDKNIIFGDIKEHSENPITYKSKEYQLYIDAPMSSLLNTVSYRTEALSIIDLLSSKEGISNNTL